MSMPVTYNILVRVESRYLQEQSDPDAGRFAFAYTIHIENTGAIAAQLIDRHWKIIDRIEGGQRAWRSGRATVDRAWRRVYLFQRLFAGNACRHHGGPLRHAR